MTNFNFIPINEQNKEYFYIDNDLQKYPEAWCYIVYSKRGPGKTYSVLDLCRRSGMKFVYLKRTIEDVKNLCAGSGNIENGAKNLSLDLSPFSPINRDKNTNIRCFMIENGIAGFFDVALDEEKNKYYPIGAPYGFVFAVSAIAKYKGFNLSECDVMIYDEFIPQMWERVSRTEGQAILSLYNTVTRDRIKRGLPEIKLICLANATQVSNQLFDVLELIDEVVDMELHKKRYYYSEYRGIVVHKIMDDEFPMAIKRAMTGIERATQGTRFAQVEYGGDFAYDDLDVLNKPSLRGWVPACAFRHQTSIYYVYKQGGKFYITKTKHDKNKLYRLSNDIECHQFWDDYGFDIRLALFEKKVDVDTYSAYNVIYNFKKIYNVT